MKKRHPQTGKFQLSQSGKRKVRSFRASDETWQKLTDLAKSQDLTVGDYLEKTVDKTAEVARLLENILESEKNDYCKEKLKFAIQVLLGWQSTKPM